MVRPFSSAFTKSLLRFYAVCYRHGMEDAARINDVFECDEAVCKLKNIKNFGTIDYDMSWNEWQFKSLQWTREDTCRKRTMDLVMALRKPTHKFGFLIQISKLYYIRGINDWIGCSDWLTLDMIKQMPKYPYLLKSKRSYRPSTTRERFEFLQGECFNLIALQNMYEAEAQEYAVPASRIRTFVERMWAAMQNPKWFDDFDLDDDDWVDADLTDDISLMRVTQSSNYTEQGQGNMEIEKKIIRQKKDAERRKQKEADRRVPREDANGGDDATDGSAIQSEPPKRRRGRPPKNV